MSTTAFLLVGGIAIATISYLFVRTGDTATTMTAGTLGVLLGCSASLYATYQLSTLPGRIVLTTITLASLTRIGYQAVTYYLDEKLPSRATGKHAARPSLPALR
ncbi:hypothetical protein EB73_06635 [Mycobacterium sp. SWH-M3]|nr:hypothetical protein EB73_06635 [Mycobacterium sp. SWH-M3]